MDSGHIHSGLALCSANQGLDSLEQTSYLGRGIEQEQAALLEMFLLCLTQRYAQAHSSEKVQFSKLHLPKPRWLTGLDFIPSATPS